MRWGWGGRSGVSGAPGHLSEHTGGFCCTQSAFLGIPVSRQHRMCCSGATLHPCTGKGRSILRGSGGVVICTPVDERRRCRAVPLEGRSEGAISNSDLREAPPCGWEGLLSGERCLFFQQKGPFLKKGLFSLSSANQPMVCGTHGS